MSSMPRTIVRRNKCVICKKEIAAAMYILQKVKLDDVKFEVATLPIEWEFVFHPTCFCQSVKNNTLIQTLVLECI